MEPQNQDRSVNGINAVADEFTGFEKVYTDIKTPGVVWRHNLVKETVDDYPEVYEIATDYAREGCIVKILPILHNGHHLRETVFIGSKMNKCPDLCVDGEYVDVKTPTGDLSLNCIDNNVKKGYKQANCVVIRIPGEVEFWKLKWVAEKRFERHNNLIQIKFKIIGKKYIVFDNPNKK